MAPISSIQVNQLSKNFNNEPVVIDVSFAIPSGIICGFLGPNGSGKTTIMRMLCGFLKPSAGTGSCLGYDLLTEAATIKKNIGYMPQRFGLYLELTVSENLFFLGRLHAIENLAARVTETIQLLDLSKYQNHRTRALSGGYKQKLALAAAILHKPKILLLDEPTAGVDAYSRQEIWNTLIALAKTGITILVSTHYMDEAERCHQLIYLAYGKLIAAGTAQAIIDDSKIATWLILGHDIATLAQQLRKVAAIEQVIERGNELRLSSASAIQLEHAIKPFITEGDFKSQRVRTTLEDAFIYLMNTQIDKRY